MTKLLVNGVADDRVDAADRGLQYGDGLFETIRVREAALPLWPRHWRRLAEGCRRLGLEGVDEACLREEAEEVASGLARGIVKIIVTRGGAGRGYRPSADAAPTRIIARHEWPAHPDSRWTEGVAVRVCRTRLGRNPALAGMKHLNRLEQVLARREWNDAATAEGLMLDDRSRVISGTMGNVFAVKERRLLTPAVDQCGVAGVMRGLLLDWTGAAEGPLTLDDLAAADEVFLCNAVIGIWPVRRIEGREYAAGPVTRDLMARLAEEGLVDSVAVSEG